MFDNTEKESLPCGRRRNVLYYYRKKFEKQGYVNFHAISMKEEKAQTEIYELESYLESTKKPP